MSILQFKLVSKEKTKRKNIIPYDALMRFSESLKRAFKPNLKHNCKILPFNKKGLAIPIKKA